MKAIIEFSLPEEQYEHKAALQGSSLRVVISTIDHTLRGYLKHGHQFKSADEAIENIRKQLHNELIDFNINLHDE